MVHRSTEIVNNNVIRYNHEEDKYAANWSTSTMVVVHNDDAFNTFESAYIKPRFKTIKYEITDMNEFEFPSVENEFASFMVC